TASVPAPRGHRAPYRLAAAAGYDRERRHRLGMRDARSTMATASTGNKHAATALTSRKVKGLRGDVTVPGDKSISHRALILGGLAIGETAIEGLLEGEDVINTARVMEQFGATVIREGEGRWRVQGVGVGGLAEPRNFLDFGNSGTG